jgi:hypothetical protein
MCHLAPVPRRFLFYTGCLPIVVETTPDCTIIGAFIAAPLLVTTCISCWLRQLVVTKDNTVACCQS